jgi:hypothetical protein
MDGELVALAGAAAGTVVSLLATDAWHLVRDAMGRLWRRAHPDRAAAIDAELVAARTAIMAARAVNDRVAEQALVDVWRARLLRLLAADQDAAAGVRQMLDEVLVPARTAGRVWTGDVDVRATASGDGRNYVVGQGYLHVSDR